MNDSKNIVGITMIGVFFGFLATIGYLAHQKHNNELFKTEGIKECQVEAVKVGVAK